MDSGVSDNTPPNVLSASASRRWEQERTCLPRIPGCRILTSIQECLHELILQGCGKRTLIFLAVGPHISRISTKYRFGEIIL